jgi:CRISPR/Cas system Type II protein with McrA/HNH and RuvC-like nuclease domain
MSSISSNPLIRQIISGKDDYPSENEVQTYLSTLENESVKSLIYTIQYYINGDALTSPIVSISITAKKLPTI